MRMVAVMLLLAVFLSACGGVRSPATGPPSGEVAVAPEQMDSRFAGAANGFSLRLFRAAWESDQNDNLFLSPASVAMALSMTMGGAEGETLEAMKEALGLKGFSLEEADRSNAALRSLLGNPGKGVELNLANSLWARKGVAFRKEFLDRSRSFYGAEVADLNFDDPSAVNTINNWVDTETKGKIKEIVEPPISADTVLFLINAIYFNGKWSKPFDPKQTEEAPFLMSSGASKQHPLMRQQGEYPYLKGEGFQAAALPYGDGRYQMVVFLPDSLDGFLSRLTAENWQTWTDGLAQKDGTIMVPRFEMESDVVMNDPLQSLGMEIAFAPGRARFEPMTEESLELYIEKVKHKSFIKVNEEGTEAAAVTSVEVRVTSAPVDPPFNLTLDRPFFFAIRDSQTGLILFTGVVGDPA